MSSDDSLSPGWRSLYFDLLRDSLADGCRQAGRDVPAGAPEESIDAHVSAILSPRSEESPSQTEQRWTLALSSLVNEIGTQAVTAAMAAPVASAKEAWFHETLGRVFRRICMRHVIHCEGVNFEARLMLLPVIFRGPQAGAFPSDLPSLTVAGIRQGLQGSLGMTPCAVEIKLIPANRLYTLSEFTAERPGEFHTMLAQVNAAIRDGRRWAHDEIVAKPPKAIDSGFDPSLVDLLSREERPPDSEKAGNPYTVDAESLPIGLWLGAKLLPVVVVATDDAWARTPKDVDLLGSSGAQLESLFRFAATTDIAAATVLGLFPPDEAILRSRLTLAREAIMADMLRMLPFLDIAKTTARIKFWPQVGIFELDVSDGSLNAESRQAAPPGALTQIYLESMAADLRQFGLSVIVDHGDGMLAWPWSGGSSVQ